MMVGIQYYVANTQCLIGQEAALGLAAAGNGNALAFESSQNDETSVIQCPWYCALVPYDTWQQYAYCTRQLG